MDNRRDKEIEKMLMRALEEAKASRQKYIEDTFNRLWKETNNSYSIYDAISKLTKDEMQSIRKTYNFKGISSLNKPELALQLSNLIPIACKELIYRMDQERYNKIKEIISNGGTIKYGTTDEMDIFEMMTFREYSIIFPGITNGEKVLFIPSEVMETLISIDGADLKRTIERNTQWIRLTKGMLHYYGVMGTREIIERIEELINEEIHIVEFVNVLSTASDFDEDIDYAIHGYKLPWILDPEKIVEEHRKRPDIGYYPFTIKQLLKASSEDYVDKTPEVNRFNSFLLRYYDMSDEDLDDIALQINTIINIDSKPTAILEFMQSIIEIPSFEFAQELNSKIIDLYNSTRQWALKGYSPNELFQRERKFINPLPPLASSNSDGKSNVINLQTRKKIGRNDPCPCGSGKKYKRCCGKS